MYESYLLDPQMVDEWLEGLNESGSEIISVIYLSDSQQVMFIIKRSEEKKPDLSSIFRENE